MKRPDLSDVLVVVGLALVVHAVYAWSPILAQLLAGSALAIGGVAIGVLNAKKPNKKRSP